MDKFIVATDRGIFYKMQQAAPNKILLAAPTGGNGATCKRLRPTARGWP